MASENSGSVFLLGFICGGFVGAVVALLYAPTSGRTLKKILQQSWGKSEEGQDDLAAGSRAKGTAPVESRLEPPQPAKQKSATKKTVEKKSAKKKTAAPKKKAARRKSTRKKTAAQKTKKKAAARKKTAKKRTSKTSKKQATKKKA